MTINLLGPSWTTVLGLGQASDTLPPIGDAQTDRGAVIPELAPNQRSRLAEFPWRTQAQSARARDSRPGGRSLTPKSFIVIDCRILGRTCT